MNPIVTNIKKFREERSIRQSDLAIATGLSERTISLLESEEGCNPTLDTAFRIAKYFNVSIDAIFKEKDGIEH